MSMMSMLMLPPLLSCHHCKGTAFVDDAANAFATLANTATTSKAQPAWFATGFAPPSPHPAHPRAHARRYIKSLMLLLVMSVLVLLLKVSVLSCAVCVAFGLLVFDVQ